jgi:hypothetical protein
MKPAGQTYPVPPFGLTHTALLQGPPAIGPGQFAVAGTQQEGVWPPNVDCNFDLSESIGVLSEL